jgi:hypothetical protein
MKTPKPWVKALNVKFQDYETWTTQLAEGQSITFWALDHGKLRTQDYLYWAREHYQLPVLKDGYFRDQASTAMLKQMRSVANWSEEMVPINSWENIIYIACVEPPQEVSWSFDVRYVLASARSLKTVWQKFQQQAKAEKAAAAKTAPAPLLPPVVVETPKPEPATTPIETLAPPPPENITIASSEPAAEEVIRHPTRTSVDVPEGMLSDDTSSGASQGMSFTDPAARAVLSLEPTPPKPTVEMPEGMVAEAPEGISFDSPIDSAEPADLSADMPEGISAEMPEGLGSEDAPGGLSDDIAQGIEIEAPEGVVFQETAVPLEDPTAPPPLQESVLKNIESKEAIANEPSFEPVEEFSKPDPSAQEVDISEDQTQIPLEDETSNLSATESAVPDEAAPPVESEAAPAATGADPFAAKDEEHQFEDLDEDHHSDHTKTQFGLTISGVNQIAPPEAVVDLDNELPPSLDQAETDKEVVAWALNELKQCFSQSMILLMDNKAVKPWKWESVWNPVNQDSLEAFVADKPGVFRIVTRTKQPYHGFIVESPANKEFFEKWGFVEMPKHATVIPLDFDGHMVGMVLSVGEETSGSETNLMMAERTVSELTNHLKDHFSKAA